MGNEFLGRPSPSLGESAINRLLGALAQSGLGRVVRRTDSALGLASDEANDMWPETITIEIDPDQVYVVFHSATGEDQERTLEIIHNVLRDAGVACDFEEE